MNCLYCGKDVGAFRLLRGSEFCSATHRTSYKDRLGKVLTRIGESSVPPPPATGFLISMPPAVGNASPLLGSWLSTGSNYPIRMTSQLPAFITMDPAGEQELSNDQTPVPCAAWMPVAQPEPAERWIEWSRAATACDGVLATVLPRTGAIRISSFASPALSGTMRVPAAEPVARFVAPGAAGFLACQPREATLRAMHIAPSLPDIFVVAGLGTTPELCTTWMPSPAAIEVARFVAPCSADFLAAQQVREPLRGLGAPLSLQAVQPELCTWMPSATAEPVTSFVQASFVAQTLSSAAALEPAFTLTAELEPLSVGDAWFEPPAACEHWTASPLPEPVWSFLSSSSAAELYNPIAQAKPVLAAAVAGPYVPSVTSLRAIHEAEPVMAGVWPCVADTPIASIEGSIAVSLPQMGDVVSLHGSLTPALAATGLAAQPVEALLAISAAARPLTGAATLCVPGIAGLSTGVPAPAVAQPCAGLEAEGVEALFAASWAGPMVSAAPVRLQAFQIGRSEECSVPGLDQPRIAATAAAPAVASLRMPVLQAISGITVFVPQPQHEGTIASMPSPGMIALEYHTQRTRSEPFARAEWKSPRFEPLPPAFQLRAVLGKLEDEVKPKTKPAGVFAMPRRTPSPLLDYAIKTAAAVLIVSTLWFGSGMVKSEPVKVARQEEAFSAPNHTLTADAQTGSVKVEPKGIVNRVQKTIAARASVQVADDFKRGMKSWGADAGQYPAGWHRNSDGYVQTGALAIFKPTVKFADYRLEFFGQIENKSVGWAVRARDEKNYHAMKFTVVEAGLRPVIAMIHYKVVDGKPGRRIQTPLNVMVHNNRPMQVAVTVRGSRFVTSINGEEVDSFSDDTLPTGGVGFFSETGERARLYWTKVTKNDDWLGHVCAFLAGESTVTAEFRLPAAPGGTPTPWSPADGDNPALAAAWIGLPYLRRSNTRRQGRCNK